MPDDSVIQAWWDHPGTIAEIAMAHKKIPDLSIYQAAMFALGVQILAAIELTPTIDPCECDDCQRKAMLEDEDDDEPWKKK
jgi:hypothetical protein